jgi:DNA polymerase
MDISAYESLRTSCAACRHCDLWTSRTQVVFGVGREDAEVLFIGEGPGEQEDLQGEPFVGRAGKLLDDMLAVIGLTRAHIYIANIVKCRPPGNRDPSPAEQEACMPWLRAQIQHIHPKIIVCLGRIAAARFIRDDFKITKEHGVFFDKGPYRVMALYHPSYLLRDPRHRPEAFEGLKVLEEEIRRICVSTQTF